MGNPKPYNLLYISDLHLGWSRSNSIVRNLVHLAQTHAPDLILLGGDLVDRKRGLQLLTQAVQELSAIAPVGAISGNHDQWVGVHLVKEAVIAGGGNWLDDRSWQWSIGTHILQIDGGLHCQNLPSPDDQSANYKILCAHNPIAIEQAQGYQLVLAGHLHGCQWVFWERQGRLYPGAWFYRWNGLRWWREKTLMLVSRGVGDTLPIRWNCPREVILCQIF